MIKSHLVAHVAAIAGLPTGRIGAAVDAVSDSMTAALRRSEEVTLVAFGSLSVMERPARPGRNPKTGAVIEIPASRAMKFRPGKALRAVVKP